MFVPENSIVSPFFNSLLPQSVVCLSRLYPLGAAVSTTAYVCGFKLLKFISPLLSVTYVVAFALLLLYVYVPLELPVTSSPFFPLVAKYLVPIFILNFAPDNFVLVSSASVFVIFKFTHFVEFFGGLFSRFKK